MAKEPKKQHKTEFIFARCTPVDKEAFIKAAKKEGMTLGEWLRQAAWEKVCEEATAV